MLLSSSLQAARPETMSWSLSRSFIDTWSRWTNTMAMFVSWTSSSILPKRTISWMNCCWQANYRKAARRMFCDVSLSRTRLTTWRYVLLFLPLIMQESKIIKNSAVCMSLYFVVDAALSLFRSRTRWPSSCCDTVPWRKVQMTDNLMSPKASTALLHHDLNSWLITMLSACAGHLVYRGSAQGYWDDMIPITQPLQRQSLGICGRIFLTAWYTKGFRAISSCFGSAFLVFDSPVAQNALVLQGPGVRQTPGNKTGRNNRLTGNAGQCWSGVGKEGVCQAWCKLRKAAGIHGFHHGRMAAGKLFSSMSERASPVHRIAV